MMRWLCALFFALALSASSASAQSYFISASGSDANNCLSVAAPCLTAQHAADLCPNAAYCSVIYAPGVYSGRATSVTYYKTITLTGPLDGRGNCPDRSAVTIDDGGRPLTLFWAQDHAILTLNCMTLKAYASGSIGFGSRQFSIGDVNNINFGTFAGGLGLAIAETSKMNVLSPGIYGNASRWASAADGSTLTVGGTVTTSGASFDVALISSLFGALVNFYPSSVTGTISGYSYQCAGGTIKNAGAMPGSGAYPGAVNCQLY